MGCWAYVCKYHLHRIMNHCDFVSFPIIVIVVVFICFLIISEKYVVTLRAKALNWVSVLVQFFACYLLLLLVLFVFYCVLFLFFVLFFCGVFLCSLFFGCIMIIMC